MSRIHQTFKGKHLEAFSFSSLLTTTLWSIVLSDFFLQACGWGLWNWKDCIVWGKVLHIQKFKVCHKSGMTCIMTQVPVGEDIDISSRVWSKVTSNSNHGKAKYGNRFGSLMYIALNSAMVKSWDLNIIDKKTVLYKHSQMVEASEMCSILHRWAKINLKTTKLINWLTFFKKKTN